MKTWTSILALLFTFIPAVYAGTVCPDAVALEEIDTLRVYLQEGGIKALKKQTEYDQRMWMLSQVDRFDQKYTDKTFVIQQAMMYGLIKSDIGEGMDVFLAFALFLNIDKVTRLHASLPFLDPTDEMIQCVIKAYDEAHPTPMNERGIFYTPYYIQKMGRVVLEDVTINVVVADGSIISQRENYLRELNSTDSRMMNDFSLIEDYLKAHPNAWPDGLVTFLYQRSPVDAVQIMAKLLGTEKDIADVAAHIEGELNAKSIEYFANRPEWWARLYVAVQIRDAGRLSPELAKQIREDPHPLIQRVLTERRPSW